MRKKRAGEKEDEEEERDWDDQNETFTGRKERMVRGVGIGIEITH